MARHKKAGREVTSTSEACPRSPKSPNGTPHQKPRISSPKWNQTQIIALSLVSLTLIGIFSVGQWYLFMVPVQGDTIISSTVFGGSKGDSIRSLIQLDDGGFILSGVTASWGQGGHPVEPYDMWLVRLDENMNVLWNQTYGTNETEWYPDIVVCPDGGFALAGQTYNSINGSSKADVLLIRTDENGNQLWNQTLGGPDSDHPASLVECEDGGFAITGSTYSYGAGRTDAWLLRTDANGNPLWNQTYGGSEFDGAVDLLETDSGFLLVGATESFTTYTTLFNTTNPDAYLICTDANGNLVWNRTYGDWTNDGFGQIIPVSSGGYLISGARAGAGNNIWFTRINAIGDIIWEKQVGTGGAGGGGLIECQDRGFAIVGSYSLTDWWIHFDLYLARTDTMGNTLWSRTYGVEELPDVGSEILQLEDGSFLIAGTTALETVENSDVWLLRVTDTPIMHYVIAQGFVAGTIISVSILVITLIIVAYHFIKKTQAASGHEF